MQPLYGDNQVLSPLYYQIADIVRSSTLSAVVVRGRVSLGLLCSPSAVVRCAEYTQQSHPNLADVAIVSTKIKLLVASVVIDLLLILSVYCQWLVHPSNCQPFSGFRCLAELRTSSQTANSNFSASTPIISTAGPRLLPLEITGRSFFSTS
jgi:hypothetical protein